MDELGQLWRTSRQALDLASPLAEAAKFQTAYSGFNAAFAEGVENLGKGLAEHRRKSTTAGAEISGGSWSRQSGTRPSNGKADRASLRHITNRQSSSGTARHPCSNRRNSSCPDFPGRQIRRTPGLHRHPQGGSFVASGENQRVGGQDRDFLWNRIEAQLNGSATGQKFSMCVTHLQKIKHYLQPMQKIHPMNDPQPYQVLHPAKF